MFVSPNPTRAVSNRNLGDSRGSEHQLKCQQLPSRLAFEGGAETVVARSTSSDRERSPQELREDMILGIFPDLLPAIRTEDVGR